MNLTKPEDGPGKEHDLLQCNSDFSKGGATTNLRERHPLGDLVRPQVATEGEKDAKQGQVVCTHNYGSSGTRILL